MAGHRKLLWTPLELHLRHPVGLEWGIEYSRSSSLILYCKQWEKNFPRCKESKRLPALWSLDNILDVTMCSSVCGEATSLVTFAEGDPTCNPAPSVLSSAWLHAISTLISAQPTRARFLSPVSRALHTAASHRRWMEITSQNNLPRPIATKELLVSARQRESRVSGIVGFLRSFRGD